MMPKSHLTQNVTHSLFCGSQSHISFFRENLWLKIHRAPWYGPLLSFPIAVCEKVLDTETISFSNLLMRKMQSTIKHLSHVSRHKSMFKWYLGSFSNGILSNDIKESNEWWNNTSSTITELATGTNFYYILLLVSWGQQDDTGGGGHSHVEGIRVCAALMTPLFRLTPLLQRPTFLHLVSVLKPSVFCFSKNSAFFNPFLSDWGKISAPDTLIFEKNLFPRPQFF